MFCIMFSILHYLLFLILVKENVEKYCLRRSDLSF